MTAQSNAMATEPVPTPEEAPACFDPGSLPLRSIRGGAANYLDVKWRLVWLREKHPDAAVETEEKAHEPGKWAAFRASVSIPGGGSATGHGSETAADFEQYYEKAETKALGRALAALGYGAQFLPDDGESLADAPGEGQPNRAGPTPIQEKANRRFHAIGSSHGWTDAALHLFAVGSYPKHGDMATNSRAELTAAELDELSKLMEKPIGRMVNQGTGEITPTPEVEYANAIAKAEDQATLGEIAKALTDAGISKNWLKAIWKRKQFELARDASSDGGGMAALDSAVSAHTTP